MHSLVHPEENGLFIGCVVISALIYLLLVVSILGIVYIGLGALLLLFTHGVLVGGLKGNGIRVSERQFPDVHRIVREQCARLEIAKVPDVYVLQQGGFLNAFATRFLGRDFVVIYSEVLELAYERGEKALAFVIGHELAHIKRKHVSRRWMVYPALMIPFLGTAYSRACEYTADRHGAHLEPAGAVDGLLVLAAGKRLYREVEAQAIIDQTSGPTEFWVAFAEWVSTHPHLTNRLNALAEFQSQPATVSAPAMPNASWAGSPRSG